MNELVRWDPFKAALPFEGSLLEMVPSLLRPVFDPRVRQAWAGPKMDVSETENAYELAVELPGVPKEAIQVRRVREHRDDRRRSAAAGDRGRGELAPA